VTAAVKFIEVLQVFCRDCARFDQEAAKCLDGKVNPQSWESAVSVSQVFGLRSICMFNDHRERLVQTRKPIGREESRRIFKD
jgi:hypothetical protein